MKSDGEISEETAMELAGIVERESKGAKMKKKLEWEKDLKILLISLLIKGAHFPKQNTAHEEDIIRAQSPKHSTAALPRELEMTVGNRPSATSS